MVVAENIRKAIVDFALSIHELLKDAKVRDRFQQHIRTWIEMRQNEDRERNNRNQAYHPAQLVVADEDALPKDGPEVLELDGPAPLYERGPWSISQCYVATAVIHDAFIKPLRKRTFDEVELICPMGVEYFRFHQLAVRDDEGRFFNEAELDEAVLHSSLKEVQCDLVAAGLILRAHPEGESAVDLISFDVVARLLGHRGTKTLQNEAAKWRAAGKIISDPCSYKVMRPLVLERWKNKSHMFPATLKAAKQILENLN